jgi:hypothetical protein
MGNNIHYRYIISHLVVDFYDFVSQKRKQMVHKINVVGELFILLSTIMNEKKRDVEEF